MCGTLQAKWASFCALLGETLALGIPMQVVINTELVNILLRQIKESTDPEVVNFCVHVLIVARSPHRKAQQFSLFVDLLRKWRHEPIVLTR